MRKMITLTIFVLMITLLIACSNDEGSNSKEKAEGAAVSETEADDSLQKIKDEGAIKVAMGGKYPPFNYLDKSNKLDGFDVDIAMEIAERLGVEFEPITAEWDSMIAGLNGNKFDVILASMAITDEREEKVDFVHYYTSGAVTIVPKENSDIKTPEDITDKVVGVGLGTTFEAKAIELGAETKTYSSSTDALTDLNNGRIDAVISDHLLSIYAINETNYPYEILDGRLYDENMGIAIRKNNESLREEISKILEDMKEDGTYTEISEKWFNEDIR